LLDTPKGVSSGQGTNSIEEGVRKSESSRGGNKKTISGVAGRKGGGIGRKGNKYCWGIQNGSTF